MAQHVSLHIGLNSVDPNHYDGWSGDLWGCENDALVYENLAKEAGFNTTILPTREATSKIVKDFFHEQSQQLGPGDFLLVTYAGHGGSIPDLNQDEEDRRDETWCLFDRQFIDDELFEAFRKFRAGVRILLFSDSCHSGSVARMANADSPLSRALDSVFEGSHVRSRVAPLGVLVRTYTQNIREYKEILERHPVHSHDVSAFVMLFAACQDEETAKEMGENGIFTSTVRDVMKSIPCRSYIDLFDHLKTRIDPRVQIPNLFKYGNPQFDFSNEPPFLGKVQLDPSIRPNKKLHTRNQTSASGLLIYSDRNIVRLENKESVSRGTGNPWDEAYEFYLNNKESVEFVEPNIQSTFIRSEPSLKRSLANNYLSNWPQPLTTPFEFIWHLDSEHSQLLSACKTVTDKIKEPKIRIGHIDTGYLDHVSLPKNLLTKYGISYVNGESENSGKDVVDTGALAEQDGHGMATLAILAGKDIEAADSYCNYKGKQFGAIPFAEIVPIRICDSVYNMFNANDMASGIEHAVNNGCSVITMSMAGYPTRRVADAVNYAYEKGVVVVTAAGNNWNKGFQKLTPKAVMYPARFDRVVAATGACFNHKPYDLTINPSFTRAEGGEFMQGNWGPASVMKTAIAGYTPNVAWASVGPHKFLKSGGGTSSATPQIAAAIALWLTYHLDEMNKENYLPWQRVEAAREAIFRSASKSYPEYKKYYGNGIIRAEKALHAFDIRNEKSSLKKTREAFISFLGIKEFISQWRRTRDVTATGTSLGDMMALEIVQLLFMEPALAQYADSIEIENPDAWDFLVDGEARKDFLTLIKESSYASTYLKNSITV